MIIVKVLLQGEAYFLHFAETDDDIKIVSKYIFTINLEVKAG